MCKSDGARSGREKLTDRRKNRIGLETANARSCCSSAVADRCVVGNEHVGALFFPTFPA